MSGFKRWRSVGGYARSLVLAATIGAAIQGTGCASERDAISRVQPNALNKHFFVGDNLSDASDDPEFRWRNYVVDRR
jgi:hypothetical protein